MSQKFYVGQNVRVQVRFQSSTAPTTWGTLPSYADTDPTAVTFAIVEPDATETEYVYGTDSEVTKQATGIYSFEAPPTQGGKHRGRAVGTGAVGAAVHFTYDVDTPHDP